LIYRRGPKEAQSEGWMDQGVEREVLDGLRLVMGWPVLIAEAGLSIVSYLKMVKNFFSVLGSNMIYRGDIKITSLKMKFTEKMLL
jgi:hypothetical protein